MGRPELGRGEAGLLQQPQQPLVDGDAVPANAYDNPLNEAYNDLYWEVQSLPSDYTVSEDLDAVSDELAAFPQAFADTFDGSGCTNS